MTWWRSVSRGTTGPNILARPEPALQRDQRPPGPVSLEAKVDTVDLGVLAGAVRVGAPQEVMGEAPCVLAGIEVPMIETQPVLAGTRGPGWFLGGGWKLT